MDQRKKQKLVFYYPHAHRISGGLYYFYSLADYISRQGIHDVYVVNYKDSEYPSHYAEDYGEVNFSSINYEDDNIKFDCNTMFIVQLHMLPMLLQSYGHLKDAKIFLIDFHPYSFTYLAGNLKIKTIDEKKNLASLILKNNSVAFMDETCALSFESQGCCNLETRVYMPTFLEKAYTRTIVEDVLDDRTVNIGMITRLDADKVWSAINVLNVVYNTNCGRNICVHMIGDGVMREKIDFQRYMQKFNVITKSYMFGNGRFDYLVEHVDFAINFGVAALEASMLPLPVVIPPFVMGEACIDSFYYINETKLYNLGCQKEVADDMGIKQHHLCDIINDIYTMNRKGEVAVLCREYVRKNHNITETARVFLDAYPRSRLSIGACLEMRQIAAVVDEFSACRQNGMYWNDYMQWRTEKV